MRYGFNISCVGDNRNYSYLQSRDGHSLTDKLAKYILKKKKLKYTLQLVRVEEVMKDNIALLV